MASLPSAQVLRVINCLFTLLTCCSVIFTFYYFTSLLPPPPPPPCCPNQPNNAVKVHLAFTYTQHYILGLIALVNSTILHCSRPQDLIFHLITDDNPAIQRQTNLLLQNLFPTQDPASFQFKTLDPGVVASARVWATYRSPSLSKPIVFARYVLPAIFPDLERLVYLDLDILVTKDIAPLYGMDMEGYPLAAARLCRESARFAKQLQMKEPELNYFNPAECSLNNGVLVYDMVQWRSSNYTEQLFYWTHLNNKKKLYKLGSQPPFNLVFYQKYKTLDKYWNLMDIAGLTVSNEPTTVAREEILQSAVLHWNGELKPWMCAEGHYAELWRSYFPSAFQAMLESEFKGNNQLCNQVVITDLNLRVDDPRAQFTVVVTSFKRVDNLVRIVNHLRRSDYIKEVLLVWNSLEPCPPSLAGRVRCFPQPDNYVHNRFAIWREVTTEGVLQHDDDVMIPLRQMEAAFKIWRQHPDQLLGFEPRVTRCVTKSLFNCSYDFNLPNSKFDLVIGKMFFISNKYQERFFQRSDLIALTSVVPCEDLAMNYLVGQISGLPPLWFKANLTEVRSKLFQGLSINSTTWRHERQGCINELNKFFGDVTVRPSTTKYSLNKGGTLAIKMPIQPGESWCSDTAGGRACRQPVAPPIKNNNKNI